MEGRAQSSPFRCTNLLLLLLLLLHCFLLSFVVAAAATNITTDQSALLALKSHITRDPHNVLAKNWSATTSVCAWIGVTCNAPHNRVHALNLSYMGLEGTIPPHLGNLSFLEQLHLQNNSFRGSLPYQMVRLRRLKFITFAYNSLSGEIPSFFGSLTKLEYLDLGGNELSGSIPASLFNASSSSLQKLVLSDNALSGSMPSTIFNMSSLQGIDLTNCSLSDELPGNIFSQLPNLQGIYLSLNHFSGQVPSSLLSCSKLQVLSLSYNNFTGSIPAGVSNLTLLTELFLGYNSFKEGGIPREIVNVTTLEKLSVPQCARTGSIPEGIGNLQNMNSLALHDNSLTGSIPPKLFNISAIERITLAGNRLSGALPSFLGPGLPNLWTLYLSDNLLGGTIPASLCNASKLVNIDLASNLFTGLVPDGFGNLRDLQYLNLGNNSLTSSTPQLSFLSSMTNCMQLEILWMTYNPLRGTLPRSVGNLSTSLESFALDYCNIPGGIPREIGNLSGLIELTLTDNDLDGSIPATINGLQNLQHLDLRGNRLQGFIPDGVCQLEYLGDLFLSNNKLSGLIPSCLGNLTSLRNLYLDSNSLNSAMPSTLWTLKDLLVLNLSSNSFSGRIPPEIGNLKVITSIDISMNQLSGTIPSTIGGLQDMVNLSLAHNRLQGSLPKSLGDLISLELLDLSHNNLSGDIPKSMESLIYLKFLNLSYNSLEGEIPDGGPFANFTAESFMINKALCGTARLNVPACTRKPAKARRGQLRVLKIVLPTAVSIMLLLVCVLSWKKYHRKQSKVLNPDDASSPLQAPKRISYHELRLATNGFDESNLLGRGGFSSVYKATLFNDNVAVKVFNMDTDTETASKTFDTECETLRNVRHRNLIKIITSCANFDFKALILEYMPNGSLEKWLHSHNYFLDMLQRLNILVDVALALEYLHHGYSMPIVHCDIKPSNVLLDEDIVAHVSDFGISKLLGEGASTARTKTLATIGYMAPEYGVEGIVSTRGDVYSYGILLMETFTRKKPTDATFAEEMSLKSWVIDALNGSITEVVDGDLLGPEDESYAAKEQCLYSIFSLATKCTQDLPEDRIDMKDVVARLQRIKETFLANTSI